MNETGARQRRPVVIDRPSLESILADLEDPICRWLPDGTLTFVNDAYCRMANAPAEALLGRRVSDIGPCPKDVESAAGAILAAITPATPTCAYEHHHRRAASEMWIQWTNRGLFDAGGRLVGVQSVGRDITSYRQAMLALQESEARYRALAESSWDVIARIGADGTCLYLSPTVRQTYGIAPEDLVGTVPRHLCHPDDQEKVIAALQQAAAGDFAMVTYRTGHRDGRWMWVEAAIRAVRDRDGAVREFVTVTRDVSERRAAEETLRRSGERLDLALGAAEMGLWDWDIEQSLMLHDERWAALLGYPLEEVSAMSNTFLELIHPDDRLAVGERLRAHLSGAAEFYLSEHRMRTKAGEWRWVSSRGRVVARTADGRPRRMIGLMRDVHEHKTMEAALRASEVQLRGMLENVLDYVAVIDLDGVLRFLNRSAPGTRIEDALDRAFDEFAPPESRRELRQAFAICIASREVQALEVHLQTQRGPLVWYAARMVPMLREGAVASVMLISTDITAQREREATLLRFNAELEERVADRTAELQASLRELEAFSYSVAHDLRAPLRAIDGFSKALIEDHAGALDADGLRFLQRVRLSAQRMGQLIDDLLRLARAMRSELSLGVVPLGAIAREIAGDLRREQPEREVHFVIDEGATAYGDPVLLRAVLTNLLANAWKFSHQRRPATIEFASEYRAEGRVFVVRDDGVGFDMAYAAKLFRPFERLHSAEFDGTGIGLAIVQRIVSRHGGRIWAESAVGRGAAFYFTLPDVPRAAAKG